MNTKNQFPSSQGQEPEFCVYNSRKFRTDLKQRLKRLALAKGKSLEEMVNLAVEAGLKGLEKEA